MNITEFDTYIKNRFPYLDIYVTDNGHLSVVISEQILTHRFQMVFDVKYKKDQRDMFGGFIVGSNITINVIPLVEKGATNEEIVEYVAKYIEDQPGIKKSKRLYELEKKLERLETMIRYMPGGLGYEEAKSHFEENI
nr:hypothetical protein K-LCC10_0202 [Kaumoebavirus]